MTEEYIIKRLEELERRVYELEQTYEQDLEDARELKEKEYL